MSIRFSPALLALVVGTVCFAQAPATSNYSFTISGSQTWTDTGLALAAGDVATVIAEVKPGSDSNCNPKGNSSLPSSDKLPLASAAGGALIVKTAESGPPVFIGPSGEVRSAEAGHLFVGINEASASNCAFLVKVNVALAQGAASAAAQAGMKDKLSSAAQVFLKSQFGGRASGQAQTTEAVTGNAAVPGAAPSVSTGGLKLPSVVLGADLRKNIDDLPRRVHDAHGNMGDMVNFVIVGSQENVQAALSAADWHVADLDSKEAGLKAIMNTYEKKDYLEMPMSHLYLWDRMQDFGYEQAQAFSVVATRHHFRLWKAPFTYNNETVWVGAATHDTGFEKDVRTGKLTHKIDPNVDDERENLASGLQKSGKTKSMTYYLPPNPVQEAKNASGGSYHSDGKLLVVFLN